MKFLVDQLQLLGLNEREVKVFTALSTFNKMNMTKIAARSGLVRTTVDAIVRRLIEQGLVSKVKVGGHWEYQVCLDDVANKLDWIEQRLRPTDNKDDIKTVCNPEADILKTTTDLADGNELTVYNDEKNVKTTVCDSFSEVEYEFIAHQGDRVLMLVSGLPETMRRMKELEHCLNYARQAKIRLELLTSTDVAHGLSKYAEELLALLASYDLRLNLLPPSFCITNVDMVVFRDLALVINHGSNTLEQVQGTSTIEALKHLLLVSKETGWSVDMRIWLEGVVTSQTVTSPRNNE